MLTIHAGTGANISSDSSESIPWHNYRSSIKEVVISENVVAPSNVSYMFFGMTNLISADLSGLDTLNVTSAIDVFTSCNNLTEINIGVKTFAQDVFTGLAGKVFVSRDGNHGPYTPADCAIEITEENAGWYNLVVGGKWGTCTWSLVDGVLTIHKGTGADMQTDNIESTPWYEDRLSIKEVVIADKVVAPANVSYMFNDMTNLTKADLSGLDTSNTTIAENTFAGCAKLTSLTIGSKTFTYNIFSSLPDVDKKGFISQDHKYGPYSTVDCTKYITSNNTGEYIIVPTKTWGSSKWYIDDGVLMIGPGIGDDIENNNAESIPWYEDRRSIKEVVIADNVIAPANISYMFNDMMNLTKADLSGLDTSNVTTQESVFTNCPLAQVKIGPKTFAKDIFTGITNKGFTSEGKNQPIYSSGNCATEITDKNAGWFEVVNANLWGSCVWEIEDDVLTIHKGTGADIPFNKTAYVPWYSHRNHITEIVISEEVIAPETIDYMFYGLENLTKADLSGLDTSNVLPGNNYGFTLCDNLAEIKIGPKTFAKDIFRGVAITTASKRFISKDGNVGPYTASECSTKITEENAGWYNVIPGGFWGSCAWSIQDGVLFIGEGNGAEAESYDRLSMPWYYDRELVEEVVIEKNVIAPSNVSNMFYDMTNLHSANLSGLDTSKVTIAENVFYNCPSLTEINVGSKTFDVDILTGLDGKQLVSQANGSPLAPGNTGWYNVVDTD